MVGPPLEIGHHVRLPVEEAPKPEQEAAVILHRLMVVVLAVDQRQKLKLAILTTVQVFNVKLQIMNYMKYKKIQTKLKMPGRMNTEITIWHHQNTCKHQLSTNYNSKM